MPFARQRTYDELDITSVHPSQRATQNVRCRALNFAYYRHSGLRQAKTVLVHYRVESWRAPLVSIERVLAA